MDFCANKEQYERDELHTLFSSMPIAGYCLRMADHMEMERQQSDAKCLSYWKLYRLLMQIMLLPSYGVISTVLKRKRRVQNTSNIWQALAYAPICASSINRALALLLVGVALRYFRDSEAFEILNILSGSQYLDVRFHDQQTLGSACNVFGYETAVAISQAIDYSCLGLSGAYTKDFLKGFMVRIRRR
jgi:hypothetical protein